MRTFRPLDNRSGSSKTRQAHRSLPQTELRHDHSIDQFSNQHLHWIRRRWVEEGRNSRGCLLHASNAL
jgi:hypothetical protein